MSEENHNFTIKGRDQYFFKTKVWCDNKENRLTRPYFFEQSTYECQQDGILCHTKLNVRKYLGNIFDGK